MTIAPVKALDEKFCTECCAVIKAKAEICPKCGVRVGTLVAPNIDLTAIPTYEVNGKIDVDLWLGVGIFLCPYVFSWWLLRDGYSKKSRFISFAWMAIVVFSFISNHTL